VLVVADAAFALFVSVLGVWLLPEAAGGLVLAVLEEAALWSGAVVAAGAAALEAD
jgi:hypothetical protein